MESGADETAIEPAAYWVLIEVATGEPLTASYFLDYVDETYTALYGL